MILRRIACSLGLALTLLGAAATPAQAAPVTLTAQWGLFPPEMGPGQAYDIGFFIGFAPGTEVDRSTVRTVVTLPPGAVFEGPGQRPPTNEDNGGPCEQDGVELTCRITNPDPEFEERYIYSIRVRIAEDTTLGTKIRFGLAISADGEETTPADNTDAAESTVAGAADLGISVKDLTVGPDSVKYTAVVRNNGPSTTDKFTYHEIHTYGPRWPGRGTSTEPGLTCRNTSNKNQCTVRHPLAPGDEYEVVWTVPIPANSPLRGTTATVSLEIMDSPSNFNFSTWFFPVIDATNNTATVTADLTGLSPSTPTTTAPTPTAPGGTAAPEPGDGGGGGGLPITGSATVPVALTGLVLLVAGAGALLAIRRRRV